MLVFTCPLTRIIRGALLLQIFSCPFVYCRIINGEQSTPASSEFVVSLEVQFENYLTWGGGTLISTNVVLTQAKLIVGSKEIRVSLGSNNLEEMQKVGVRNYIYHPYYTAQSYAYDFALLRLAQSVDSGNSPICD